MSEARVLDNEQRKKLAEVGGLGFTENPDFIYTPKMYRKKDDNDEYIVPKELWPVFTLQGKDGIEASKLEDGLGHMEYNQDSDVRRYISKFGTKRIDVLRDSIKEWRNFFDGEGKEIPFRENNGKISNHSLKLIPAKIADDLANAIIGRNILTPEELEGLES